MPLPLIHPRNDDLMGIGGWLLLPAIGLVANSFLWLKAAAEYLQLYSRISSNSHVSWVVAAMIVRSFLFAAFVMFVAVQFFRRRLIAPRLMIILLWSAPAVAGGGVGALSLALGKSLFSADYVVQLIASIVSASIWTGYFVRSARVKNTFTR